MGKSQTHTMGKIKSRKEAKHLFDAREGLREIAQWLVAISAAVSEDLGLVPNPYMAAPNMESIISVPRDPTPTPDLSVTIAHMCCTDIYTNKPPIHIK